MLPALHPWALKAGDANCVGFIHQHVCQQTFPRCRETAQVRRQRGAVQRVAQVDDQRGGDDYQPGRSRANQLDNHELR